MVCAMCNGAFPNTRCVWCAPYARQVWKHVDHTSRKWDELKPMQRELASTSFRKKSMRVGETEEVLDLVDIYKMQELKELALRNYIVPSKLDGNKSWKKTWAKAYVKTKDWGFNTFVVGVKNNKKHPLCGQVDVLLMIQDLI